MSLSCCAGVSSVPSNLWYLCTIIVIPTALSSTLWERRSTSHHVLTRISFLHRNIWVPVAKTQPKCANTANSEQSLKNLERQHCWRKPGFSWTALFLLAASRNVNFKVIIPAACSTKEIRRTIPGSVAARKQQHPGEQTQISFAGASRIAWRASHNQ